MEAGDRGQRATIYRGWNAHRHDLVPAGVPEAARQSKGRLFASSLIAAAGVAVGLVSTLLAILVLAQYLTDWTIFGFNPHQARGWTSLIMVLLFSSATQLFCLGILGEYIGRLFEEVKRRPLYLVKRRINIEAVPPPRA